MLSKCTPSLSFSPFRSSINAQPHKLRYAAIRNFIQRKIVNVTRAISFSGILSGYNSAIRRNKRNTCERRRNAVCATQVKLAGYQVFTWTRPRATQEIYKLSLKTFSNTPRWKFTSKLIVISTAGDFFWYNR